MSQNSGNTKLAAIVSERIHLSRKTIKEIAERSGLKQSHLSLVKSGKRGLSASAAEKLAIALNLDPATLAEEIAELIEAARAPRDIPRPVQITTTPIQVNVPPHSVGLFGELQTKIRNQEILTRLALFEFERQWDRGGDIYIYAEEGKALEIHDSGFLRLTSENITERQITYHFALGDPLEAQLVAERLFPVVDPNFLHIYKRKKKKDEKIELSDPFETRRICVIYDAPGRSPIVYEKILDDPLLFHRVGVPLASGLLDQLKAKEKSSRWEEEKPRRRA